MAIWPPIAYFPSRLLSAHITTSGAGARARERLTMSLDNTHGSRSDLLLSVPAPISVHYVVIVFALVVSYSLLWAFVKVPLSGGLLVQKAELSFRGHVLML